MKSLVIVSVLGTLVLAVPSTTAAAARSSEGTVERHTTSTLVVHACRGYRPHHGWYAPPARYRGGYGYDRHWGQDHKRHYGRHARKHGHHSGKHSKGHRGHRHYR